MTTAASPVAQDDKHVHVRIRPNGGYRFVASFPDLPNAGSILLDEPPPLGDGAGPNPAGALAAAIGGCLAASLTFCLRRAHIDGTVDADAEANLARNAQGRFRIAGVTVALTVHVSPDDRARLERCSGLFEDFCIVTESVRRGIPVTLSLEEDEQRPAA